MPRSFSSLNFLKKERTFLLGHSHSKMPCSDYASYIVKRLLIIFYPSGKLNLGARGLDIPRASASQFGQFKLSLLKRKKSYFFFYYGFYYHTGASLIVHLVKNMPAMQETPV